MEEDITALKDLHSRYLVEFNQLVAISLKKLEYKHQQVLEEKNKLEMAFEKLQKLEFPSVIVLDVGGTKFSTSLSTLRSQMNSFFDVMFSERWNSKPQEDGSYFVDRDPFVFRHILNFMRDETLPFNDLKQDERNALAADAIYYQLDRLTQRLTSYARKKSRDEFVPERTSRFISLTNDDQTATCDALDNSNTSFRMRTAEVNDVIPSTSTRNAHSYKFRVEMLASWIALGLTDSARQDCDSSQLGHGFYLVSSDGFSWHSSSEEYNMQQLPSLFTTGNVITMEYDAKNKLLSFRCENWPKKFIMPVTCERDLIPVVLLHQNGDSVTVKKTIQIIRLG